MGELGVRATTRAAVLLLSVKTSATECTEVSDAGTSNYHRIEQNPINYIPSASTVTDGGQVLNC